MATNNTTSIQQIKQAETDIAVLQVRFTNLDEKIDDLKVDISDIRIEIKDNSEKSTALIKDFQADNIKSHKEMSSKISALEKWRWMIMGAGIVIGSLGSFVAGILF
jgi:predicted  nucleic acid-binding Zn-ribbon protein